MYTCLEVFEMEEFVPHHFPYDPVKELDMPEFGVIFKFNADYDHVSWYGLENLRPMQTVRKVQSLESTTIGKR